MKILVINRNIVRSNKKHNVAVPPIRVANSKSGKVISYCSEFEFNCKGRLVYDPTRPLGCGATAWLELDI